MKIGKYLLVAATAGAVILAATLPAQAATTNNDLTVKVSLNSQCQATNSGTQTIDFGSYTAFQAGPINPAAVNLTFRCTRSFPPVSVAFDVANGNAAGVGVLAGLQYTLTAGAPSTVAGTAATVATIGSGDAVTYAISSTMPADQAGTCAVGTCSAQHTRTLILTF
jgi:hypothetical protein